MLFNDTEVMLMIKPKHPTTQKIHANLIQQVANVLVGAKILQVLKRIFHNRDDQDLKVTIDDFYYS